MPRPVWVCPGPIPVSHLCTSKWPILCKLDRVSHIILSAFLHSFGLSYPSSTECQLFACLWLIVPLQQARCSLLNVFWGFSPASWFLWSSFWRGHRICHWPFCVQQVASNAGNHLTLPTLVAFYIYYIISCSGKCARRILSLRPRVRCEKYKAWEYLLKATCSPTGGEKKRRWKAGND